MCVITKEPFVLELTYMLAFAVAAFAVVGMKSINEFAPTLELVTVVVAEFAVRVTVAVLLRFPRMIWLTASITACSSFVFPL